MSNLTAQRAEIPPRDDLLRMAPFALRADAGEEGDGRTLDGWAAVFNRETIIDSWEGRFRENLSPGSMKKSFRERPPRIQFDHGRHPLVGSIPIAQLQSIREESDPEHAPDGGAHVVGRLHDNWLIQPVRDAISSGAIDGMSFRFTVVQERWVGPDGKQIRDQNELADALERTWYESVPDDELLLRDLREVKVAEVGPVVWPAYEATSVGVRSTVIDLGRLGDPEQRKALARAVFLADAAERMTAEQSPQPTEAEQAPAGEHDEADGDEPQATEDDTPAGEHPSTGETTTEPEPERHSAPAEPAAHSTYLTEPAGWFLPSPGHSSW
jgi:phage head maturation protease